MTLEDSIRPGEDVNRRAARKLGLKEEGDSDMRTVREN